VITKTYIRKTREGWKMVHKEYEPEENYQSATVIAPLSKEDAELLRDTFKTNTEQAKQQAA
jgi:hypothetical protein